MKLLTPSAMCRGFLLLSLIYLHAGYADGHPNPPRPCCRTDEAAGRGGMISERQETRPQHLGRDPDPDRVTTLKSTVKGSGSTLASVGGKPLSRNSATRPKFVQTRKQNREKMKLDSESEEGNVDQKRKPTEKPQTINVGDKWSKWNLASSGNPKKALARDSNANNILTNWKKWNLRSKPGPPEAKEN